jgi:hypothetical protein
LGTVRCTACGADNPESEGGAPFFCRQCHEIVDPSGKRKGPPAPTVPATRAPREGKGPAFVSQYGTTAPTYQQAPGAGFSVAGFKPVGYVFAAVAAAVAGVGLGWVGLHYLNVPILFSLLAGWGIKRALAAGSGGGTPDRGPIGLAVLAALVVATFGAGRYVEYLATARHRSQHYEKIFGPTYATDVEGAIFELRGRDVDRDGAVTLPDATTYRVREEEQRLRAAHATGIRPNDAYDVALLAESGRPGLLGHVRHVIANGTEFRFTPRGRAIPLEGYMVLLWWFVELLVLGLVAFSRVD